MEINTTVQKIETIRKLFKEQFLKLLHICEVRPGFFLRFAIILLIALLHCSFLVSELASMFAPIKPDTGYLAALCVVTTPTCKDHDSGFQLFRAEGRWERSKHIIIAKQLSHLLRNEPANFLSCFRTEKFQIINGLVAHYQQFSFVQQKSNGFEW